jgi:hypothetical protein
VGKMWEKKVKMWKFSHKMGYSEIPESLSRIDHYSVFFPKYGKNHGITEYPSHP